MAEALRFRHYGYVFDKIETLPYNFFNSIYVTGGAVLITCVCAVLAGYALVHLKPGVEPLLFSCCFHPFIFLPVWFQ